MKCPFCGEEKPEDVLACPVCRNTYRMEQKSGKKSSLSAFWIVMMILLALIPFALGCARLLPSLPVKLSSTKVDAVISQADPARSSTSFGFKKSQNGTSQETYTLRITQRIMVEYTMDGETRRGDLGVLDLYERESGMNFSQAEIDRYVDRYSLEAGEPLTVYVNDIGEVSCAENIDWLFWEGMVFFIGGEILVGGLFALIFTPAYIRKKKKNQ